jgi:hypothetical protein
MGGVYSTHGSDEISIKKFDRENWKEETTSKTSVLMGRQY